MQLRGYGRSTQEERSLTLHSEYISLRQTKKSVCSQVHFKPALPPTFSLAYLEVLVRNARVAGVENVRSDGSLVIRAWVALTAGGQKLDEKTLQQKLNEWIEGKMSRHKWLSGGIEIVSAVD